MSPSDLQETQQKVVPAGATQVTPIIVALLRRCFPQWLVRDILAPLAVSRVALIIVAWLGLHLLQVRLNGTKWEVASNGYGQIVAEHRRDVRRGDHTLVCPCKTIQRSFFPALSGPNSSSAVRHSAAQRCRMALSRNHCVKRCFAFRTDLSLPARAFGF